MNRKTGVAVVGCGYWGPNLIRNLLALPECRLAHVCDANPARLAHIKGLYPLVNTTEQLGDVLTDRSVDAVVVATPIRTHYPLARQALLAGKHVFLEKPMAASVAHCEELIELADARGLVLMVGHTFLYSSPVAAIRQIVERGELGPILYVTSRRLNLGLFQKDINVMWDLAPHDIAVILHILNDAPASVTCLGKASIAEGIEDVTNMTITLQSGVLAFVHSSWLDPNKVREMTFVGKQKMLVFDDLQPTEKIKIFDKRVEVPPHYDTFAEFQYSYHYGDVHIPYIKEVEPLKTECQHFVDCIRQGQRPLSDGWNGMEVVKVLEAGNRSLVLGGAAVPLDHAAPLHPHREEKPIATEAVIAK